MPTTAGLFTCSIAGEIACLFTTLLTSYYLLIYHLKDVNIAGNVHVNNNGNVTINKLVNIIVNINVNI